MSLALSHLESCLSALDERIVATQRVCKERAKLLRTLERSRERQEAGHQRRHAREDAPPPVEFGAAHMSSRQSFMTLLDVAWHETEDGDESEGTASARVKHGLQAIDSIARGVMAAAPRSEPPSPGASPSVPTGDTVFEMHFARWYVGRQLMRLYGSVVEDWHEARRLTERGSVQSRQEEANERGAAGASPAEDDELWRLFTDHVVATSAAADGKSSKAPLPVPGVAGPRRRGARSHSRTGGLGLRSAPTAPSVSPEARRGAERPRPRRPATGEGVVHPFLFVQQGPGPGEVRDSGGGLLEASPSVGATTGTGGARSGATVSNDADGAWDLAERLVGVERLLEARQASQARGRDGGRGKRSVAAGGGPANAPPERPDPAGAFPRWKPGRFHTSMVGQRHRAAQQAFLLAVDSGLAVHAPLLGEAGGDGANEGTGKTANETPRVSKTRAEQMKRLPVLRALDSILGGRGRPFPAFLSNRGRALHE